MLALSTSMCFFFFGVVACSCHSIVFLSGGQGIYSSIWDSNGSHFFFDSHSCSINNKPTFLKSLSRFSFRFIAGFVCWFVFCEANIIEFLAARYPTVSCNTWSQKEILFQHIVFFVSIPSTFLTGFSAAPLIIASFWQVDIDRQVWEWWWRFLPC